MAFTHKIQTIYSDSSGAILNTTASYSADGQFGYSGQIAIGATNKEIDIAFLVANLKSFILISDQALTLKTNSTTSPGDTIAIAAGVPIVWGFGGALANPFGVDVTKFYFTNASGVAANLTISGCAHISV